MEEELKALAELVQETAKKYALYITAHSFYGESGKGCLTYQAEEDHNIGNFKTIEGE